MVDYSQQIIKATRKLANSVNNSEFSEPVTHVYNPLLYARKSHELYLKQFAHSNKKVVFMGMNPGPFGMAQTGIPFGQIELVRDWMGIEATVKKPNKEHPRRPVEGFACSRNEVSGGRLWGLFKDRYQQADIFFREHYVSNYCPLLFLNERGSNVIPEKIPQSELTEIYTACDRFMIQLLQLLQPQFLVGVGNFAFKKGQEIVKQMTLSTKKNQSLSNIQIVKILHPSPASPAANRGWANAASQQLIDAGVW